MQGSDEDEERSVQRAAKAAHERVLAKVGSMFVAELLCSGATL